MKCPDCQKKHRRGKEGMYCACGYQFLIDPKIFPGWSDNKFIQLLKLASANESHFFTPSGLRFESLRKTYAKRKKNIWILLGFWTAMALIVWLFLSNRLPEGLFFIFLFIGLAVTLGAIFGNRPVPVEALLEIWKNAKSPLPKLIEAASPPSSPPLTLHKDIYDYGFEKLLITDDYETLDWLVTNHFHVTQVIALLTLNGEPSHLLPIIQKELSQNPQVKIFLLHGTQITAEQMLQKIKQQNLLPLEGRSVIDLGISPSWMSKFLKQIKWMKPNFPSHALPYNWFQKRAQNAITAGVPLAALVPLFPNGSSTATSGDTGSDEMDFG